MPSLPVSELDVFTCPLDGIKLIEASAGTGKTWNICALYLRQLLTRDIAVDQVLVVTFTRAATAELTTRIRQALGDTLRVLDGGKTPDESMEQRLITVARAAGVDAADMRQRLENALANFDQASIFTIHGFCQRALADAPFAAGLPYGLELADGDLDLRLEVTRDFWRREVAHVPVALADHLLALGDSPEHWADWLGKTRSRPLAQVRWDEAVAAAAAPEDIGDLDALVAARAAAHAEARRCWGDGQAPRAAIMAAHEKRHLNGNVYKIDAIERAARQWAGWMAANDTRPLADDKLALLGATKLGSGTNKHGKSPAHAFFRAAQALLDACEQLDEALDIARLRLLRRFIESAGVALRERKLTERRIAFDDILWNAFDALASGRRPGLSADLHRRYPVALVDEFQDTDPLQLAIFRHIYADEGRHGNLFLVGDPKQAIYSFRGADLYAYLDARALADTCYSLDTNYRSTPALVAASNHLFALNPAAFMTPGIDFRAVKASANAARLIDPGALPAALRLWRIPRDEPATNDTVADIADAGGERLFRAHAIQRAAAASAAEIARLLDAGNRGDARIDDGEAAAHPLLPADFAVLVRSHREGRIMRQALARLGVGSVELSQASVFATPDAAELERVLRAIAEPAREERIRAALATVSMGWNADDLAALDGDSEQLFAAIERFAEWGKTWEKQGFAAMLRRWMRDAGVAARLLVRDDGERRLTNLLHLAELLTAETGSPAVSLRALARHRRDAAEGRTDDAVQLRLESDRNLVRIVTIHRAKGLQYNIVFCPFLFDNHTASSRDKPPFQIWHDARADGRVQVTDWRRGARNDSGIKNHLRAENAAERLRLIYVALTRAKHRCYLTVGAYAQRHGKSVDHTESVRGLLNWMVAGTGMEPDEWWNSRKSPAEIDACWRALAQAAGKDEIALEDLPSGEGVPLAAEESKPRFSALAAPRIPSGWRMGSFSALVSGAKHEIAAQDHDARIDDALPSLLSSSKHGEKPPPADDDILLFPRGPVAGDCLHAVFEHLDFTNRETWSPAIEAALAACPQTVAPELAPRLPRMLARLVEDVLATPLTGADNADILRLETVPLSRRLTESGFYLPAPRLNVHQLNRWLATHGYAMPRLAFGDPAGELGGYLKGYIDLIFEHAGRYWIIDWKSNHLGDSPADYGPAALAAAMAHHAYHLQHLLYTVALHRHLGRTLDAYDYERHFGGVLYLFVRGVRPGWQIDGQPAGVFHHRAPRETIESLDRLLIAHAG